MQLPFQNRYTITLDDDPMVYRLLESMLDTKSLPFFSSSELLANLSKYRPVAVFVDIHLGVESGLQVIPHLKARWPFAPIIVMTSDLASNAVSEALACGADDFVRKPINQNELVSRLQVRFEDLAQREAKSTLRIGELCLDTANRVIKHRGKESNISGAAVTILSTLMQATGTARSRHALKRRVWGPVSVTDSALDRKVHEVRSALKAVDAPAEILNVYGQGFLLECKK
jgi:DNA-binding response OmpR family regulator